jgi:predicted RNA-binding Zn-ribbon protein involved in translation (DUF1610 family)
MDVDRNLVSPCGLYCGVCAIRIATVDDNDKFRERLAPVYGVKPEDLYCEGCLAPVEKVWTYCKVCPIKTCAGERGYEGCHQCDEWPCAPIESFPIPVGKKVIMRAIPRWREVGTETWVEEEEQRYKCPNCGAQLFRGAKRCRECKETVDVD